jgi:hypothetical protein
MKMKLLLSVNWKLHVIQKTVVIADEGRCLLDSYQYTPNVELILNAPCHWNGVEQEEMFKIDQEGAFVLKLSIQNVSALLYVYGDKTPR